MEEMAFFNDLNWLCMASVDGQPSGKYSTDVEVNLERIWGKL